MRQAIRPGTLGFDHCACLLASASFIRATHGRLYRARVAALRHRYKNESRLFISTLAAMTLGEL